MILTISLAIFFSCSAYGQDFFEEFENLIDDEKTSLLPEKIIFTQKIFWGKNGLFRKTGISKLSLENREKELVLREKMLKAHQILGYVTFVGMIAQGILGGKLYQGKKREITVFTNLIKLLEKLLQRHILLVLDSHYFLHHP